MQLVPMIICVAIMLVALRRVIVSLYQIPWIAKAWKAGDNREYFRYVARAIGEIILAAFLMGVVSFLLDSFQINASSFKWEYRTIITITLAALAGGIFLISLYFAVGKRDPRKREQEALRCAIKQNDHTAIKKLIESGANVNSPTVGGITPLMVASSYGNPEILQTLLTAGADVSARDDSEFTALLWASHKEQQHVIEMLLKAGANVNEESRQSISALINSAASGFADNVDTLLKWGAEVNRQTAEGPIDGLNQVTALIAAVKGGHSDIVNALLNSGADVKVTDNNGKTALEIAIEKGHEDIVYLLRQAENLQNKVT